jgi:hypothetical protein
MNITKSEEFCKCRSYRDGERCRFFKGWEPLKPGFEPDPRDPGFKPGGDAEELFPPDRLLNLKRSAHYVYRIEGEGVPDYEYACIGAFSVGEKGKETLIPYAWFSQSDTFLQGAEALERIGVTVEDDLLYNYAPAINAIDEAVQEYVKHWPQHRIALAFDDGTGLEVSGNDTALMRAIYDADAAK